MVFSFERQHFPDDFQFGVATAAYQIEGNRYGGCGLSHWDTWARTPGNVFQAHTGTVACDHYHRFNEDLDLIKTAGFDIYRFSTSWARVMPDGQQINPAGLDFYDRLVDAILERGLSPYLTLYHWDLPAPLADIGGWANREIPLRFADYSQTLIRKIGDRVSSVATLNEPWCVAWLGYFIGHHAPGLRDIRQAARAMHHVLLGHALSLQALRSHAHQHSGIVLNLTETQAASEHEQDQLAAQRLDGIHNRWFLDALFKQQYPADILEELEPYMPSAYQDDMAIIGAPIDWLGINYYSRALMNGQSDTPWPSYEFAEGTLPKTAMGWEIYPQGLNNLLQRVSHDYSGRLPLYITENGMAADDQIMEGKCHDPQRLQYLDEHLQSVLKALTANVPVKGYLAWSLLDNFEWAYGYDKRFGLVYVDYETQKRTAKSSYHAFRKLLTEC